MRSNAHTRDTDDQTQGAFRADDEVEQVAAREPRVEGVARGVLAGAGKAGGDQRRRLAKCRGQLRLESACGRAVAASAAPAKKENLARGRH